MPAYVVVNVTIRDPVRYEEYGGSRPRPCRAYGGRYVARGAPVDVREGGWSPVAAGDPGVSGSGAGPRLVGRRLSTHRPRRCDSRAPTPSW